MPTPVSPIKSEALAAAPPIAAVLPATAKAAARPKVPIKLIVAGSAALAGAYGMFSEQNYVSSSNAVVSAFVVSVRTPVDGLVRGLPPTVNLQVQEGEVLGHIDNPLVDRQHLENLRVIEERARSEADAISVEKNSLEEQRKQLLARAKVHAASVTARLNLRILEDERLALVKEAAQKQAALDLARAHQLRDAGIISAADLDKAQTQYDIAVKETQAQQAALSASHAEANSAARGIYIEPGNNEIDYSRQRSDEIELRLADINHTLAALESQAQAAKEDLDKESARINQMAQSDLVSPISGLLWKLDAMNGERINSGDSVAEFVDCSQSFVLADIPQDRVPDIMVGAQARIKLSGESNERSGIITAINAGQQKEQNRKLAAAPLFTVGEQPYTARVDFASGELPEGCSVGRTARVLLATRGTSLASRMFRRNF
jgi:multidrug resistance efflux pump